MRLKLFAIASLSMVLAIYFGTRAIATPQLLMAKAAIAGAPDSGISGTVLFYQVGTGILPTVKVVANIKGLTPGEHGFHLHEKAICDAPAFKGAGGHFDPGPNGNPDPDTNHPYHLGDLPSLVADDHGEAVLTHTTSRVTLSPGLLTLLDADGSAVIVHQNPDQGVSGTQGSGVGGGSRIGCGAIEVAT